MDLRGKPVAHGCNSGANSAPTITCLGATTPTACTSESPTSWVLMSATMPPVRVIPSQIAK
jgi:hypothetical protein